jgi:hypothetical protein
MNIQISNLGYIKSAQLSLGDLTIVCGNNNTGKTYLSYAIHGFFKNWRENTIFEIEGSTLDELASEGFTQIDLVKYESQIPKVLKQSYTRYSKSIHQIFSTEEDSFSDFELKIDLDSLRIDYSAPFQSAARSQENDILSIQKKEGSSILEISNILNAESASSIPKFILTSVINNSISEVFFGHFFARPFIVTSERAGISLFFKELDINKNILLERLQDKKKIDHIDFIGMINDSLSRYAKSIRENIDIIRDYDSLAKQKSFLFQEKAMAKPFVSYFENMLGGSFKTINEQIYFVPQTAKSKKGTPIPLYAASSSVKSLLLIDLYVKHLARPNDFLMIDEPELNLHPSNQRLVAQLIVSLVNRGVKVFLTTHSDLFVKEINNLIMLKSLTNGSRKPLLKKYGYDEHELISKDRISVYVTEEEGVKSVNFETFGVQMSTLEEVISEQVQSSEDIYFKLLEQADGNGN